MLAKITSCALVGLEGALVQVEVDISRGLGSFTIVGLPDAAISESRQRVRAAVKNSGFYFPTQRITVNLAPADLRKEGPAYDLPIAIGLLAATEQMQADIDHSLFVGELSLDGGVRHTNGVLPMASLAKQMGIETMFVPEYDAPEAALIAGLHIHPAESLGQIVLHFADGPRIEPYVHGQALSDDGFRYDGVD